MTVMTTECKHLFVAHLHLQTLCVPAQICDSDAKMQVKSAIAHVYEHTFSV